MYKYSIGIYAGTHYEFFRYTMEDGQTWLCKSLVGNDDKPHFFKYFPDDQFCYPVDTSDIIQVLTGTESFMAVMYDDDNENIATTEVQYFDQTEEAKAYFNKQVEEGSKEVSLCVVLETRKAYPEPDYPERKY